ncbi:glutamate-gated chloride channel-like isoform X2 [Brevipalpus obovatus]|uniref:glutamate-gated chloride channel-like isoform X2 n=1 Tax=Brevipalpus obovatus TaxID=246614 RepID=UPI003D9DB80E
MKSVLSVTIICLSYLFEIIIIPWIIVSMITLESLSGESIKSLEKQILDQILGRNTDRQIYDNRIRPNGSSHGNDGPCEVTVNFLIRSISEISDLDMEYATQLTFREEWLDDRLKYDNRDGQIKYLTLTDPSRIWLPDLFFKNEKEGHFHDIIMPNVLLRIHPDGRVLYSVRISLVLACSMDLKFYPMDNQWCDIIMASYGYTTKDVIFYWQTKEPVQVQMLNLPRFQLSNYTHNYCTSKTITGEYSCIRLELCFKREFSYYLIHIYLPCIMLVIVSWVSFWLDPNAIPARVSLGVTTLLTMATQISSINSSLPPPKRLHLIDAQLEKIPFLIHKTNGTIHQHII